MVGFQKLSISSPTLYGRYPPFYFYNYLFLKLEILIINYPYGKVSYTTIISNNSTHKIDYLVTLRDGAGGLH